MEAEWEGSCEGLATASAGGRIAGAEEEGMGRRMGRGLGVEAVAGLGAEVAGLGAEVARLGAEVARLGAEVARLGAEVAAGPP